MHRRQLLWLLLFALPVAAERSSGLTDRQCDALRQRIRKLESSLRDGHSARQGRDWKRRIRELQLQRFRGCR